ncbi:hypothetical protein BDN67DRAFT_982224 [Paxillus ammoniavirescens]|nr:hypothetical protein BDN67DRAFT_982224 [Paxillus ammoniavirescens]
MGQREADREECHAKGGPPRPNLKGPRERDALRIGTNSELEDDPICITQIQAAALRSHRQIFTSYLSTRLLHAAPKNGPHFEDIARISWHRVLGQTDKAKAVSQKVTGNCRPLGGASLPSLPTELFIVAAIAGGEEDR